MTRVRDEKKEREARLQKREQLKVLSRSLVARRNLGEYMGNEDDTVNGLLRFHYACNGYTNLNFQGMERGGLHRSQRRKSPADMGNACDLKSGKAAH